MLTCFQLYLDDSRMKNFTSCFKEKKFLDFFFKRLRLNSTQRYQEEFPFISLCGRERNFIRCDDVPIVYTNVLKKNDSYHLSFGYADDLLTTEFQPDKLYMLPLTGRVYHPADDKYGGVGLVKSKLAIEFSKSFEFNNAHLEGPSHFNWKNERYELDQLWFANKVKEFNLKINSISD